MRRINTSVFQGDPPKLDMSQFWNTPVQYPFNEEQEPSPPANRTQLAIDRGYLPEREEGLSNQEYMDALAENPKEKKPFDFFNFGLGMRRASAGLSWLSGIKERNRQNQYLQNQLSTLGQLDALPAEQPNPYNLYAKYGGKLSKFGGGGGNEDPKKKDIDPKVLARMQNPQQGDLSSQMGIINQNNQIKIQQNAPVIKKYMEDKNFNRRMNNQPTLSARKKLTPYEQEQADEYRRKRNEQYVALHPERTLNEQGDIVKSGFGEFVDKYGDNLDKFANSLETPMAIQGAGELLYAGAKYALPKLGNYLTTQTPLKNTYKINPWAFKPNPEMMYRGIGEEGMKDALESGVFRAKQNVQPSLYEGFDLSKQFKSTYYTPKFNTADQYGKGFIAEVPKDVTPFRLRYKGKGNKTWSQIADEEIPIDKGRILKKDWLTGYKEVPVPTQSIKPPSLNDSIKNLEDLKYAKNWAKEYGYKLPENLERISQSKELTDRTIRGLMDRHNTFTRGVSTNWKFLEEKNPEILRHLEGKGFDLTSEEGTKKAAEYMATHIPIETGYGRASLNKSIFDKGMDGLYTSNSIPTAEGYTYGDGFIVKAKKPTNFTSVNRRDWVDNNQFDYMTSLKKDKQELQKSFMFTNSTSEDISNLEMHYGKENANIIKNWYDDIHKKEIELRKKYNINNTGEGNYSINHIVGKKLDDSDYASGKFDEIVKNHKENVSKFTHELIEYKSKTQKEVVKNFVSNDSHVLKSILKTEHYPGKPEEFFQVGNKDIGLGKIHSDIIPNLGLSSRETDRLKNDIIGFTEGFRKKGWDTKKISENLKEYLKDQYQNDPYAHYIHLGTPGEKVLEPVWSKRITPEIWKNKSRAHTNTYSKGLTAASVIPVMMATSSLNKKEFKKGGLTPNKAREILHDGTAQGHPLTDKQRRFFGAKSKGHTNFRGRK
jgi:hypothetical protein